MKLKKGDKVFVIKGSKIIEGTLIEIRDESQYVFFENGNMTDFAPSYKVYDSKEVVENELLNIKQRKKEKINRSKENKRKIDEICHKIWLEFDIEIPFLSRPYSLDEAQRLYKRIKRERYSK